MLDARFLMLDARYWILDNEDPMLMIQYQVSSIQYLWILASKK